MNFVALLVALGQVSLPNNGTEPCWSSDGSKVAFGVSEGQQRSLWTMDSDGTNARRLVPAGDSQHYLRWFPDASRLVYVAPEGKGYRFVSIKPDGSDSKALLPDSAPKPELVPLEWAPNGRWVTYASKQNPDAKSRIAIVDKSNGDVVAWIPGERSHGAHFSPDGTRLAYLAQSKVWVADGRGQNGKAIVEPNQPWIATEAAWSPDGTQILYCLNNQEWCELWTCLPDGSDSKRLYKGSTRFFYPTWSPKGDRILFALRKTETWDLWLYTVDPSGKNLAKVVGADSGAPIWDLEGSYTLETTKVPVKPGDQPEVGRGTSVWSRALDGTVIREHWRVRAGGRPMVGELSMTRSAPNTYEAVQLNEWTGEQYSFSGRWDPEFRRLTFDRILPQAEAPREFMRWIYAFGPDGSFTKQVMVGDPKGTMSLQSTYRYEKAEALAGP